ncbi:MAG: hypothetical protein IPI21_09385 [Propionivibrio sp.]|nr:hypothetical protein [Propionivibrio sp.]
MRSWDDPSDQVWLAIEAVDMRMGIASLKIQQARRSRVTAPRYRTRIRC